MVATGGQKSPQEAIRKGTPKAKENAMSQLSDLDLGFKQLKYGSIVSGTVVQVSPREILIDIGFKSEGIVDPSEMEKMSPDAIKKIQVGDQVLAFVLRSENRDGNAVLSLVRAQMEHDWRDAEELLKSGDVFEAQVAGFNKGGLIVRVGKVRAFVPATQIESVMRRKFDAASAESAESELAALVGKKLRLKVIELDRARNRLILSERAAMREFRKGQKDRLLTEIKEGDKLTGAVTSVADFGVFVDLGGVDGMIHLSEMSWTKIGHPGDLVKVGDQVQVEVLGIDRERERIALSLKRLQPEPWMTVEDRYKVGQIVPGTITKLASFGAFARLDDNIEGLIHISELSDRRIQHPKEAVKEGDAVQLRVIRVDANRRRLGLSLKRATEEYDDAPIEPAPPEEDWPEVVDTNA